MFEKPSEASSCKGRANSAEFGRSSRVTRQTISLIEKGNYNPSSKLCLQICCAVNSKLDDDGVAISVDNST